MRPARPLPAATKAAVVAAAARTTTTKEPAMTATQIAEAIRANVRAFYARAISHDAFTAEQRRLWGDAAARGFLDDVRADMIAYERAHPGAW